MSLLEVNGLNTYYGDSHILFDVSLRVEQNEVVGLLGRNGAGKSTTLKSLMGVVTPRAGSVKFDGQEIAGKKSHTIALAGMQLVHEDRRIFGSLNVEENLVLAGLTLTWVINNHSLKMGADFVRNVGWDGFASGRGNPRGTSFVN